MKAITKSIEINAPKEKVWNVLLEDEYNRLWLSEFCAGTHAETDWIEGHKIVFKDASGMGMSGTVTAKQPYDLITITYDGMITAEGEIDESEESQSMKGAKEEYKLSEEGGITTLNISSDMDESYHDQMSEMWDKALEKISELSISI